MKAFDVWPRVAVEHDLARARREWLFTNGAGAYASSTVACMHTRRYHGLLVAALDPPRARHVLLSHVDATLTVEGRTFELFTHQFPGLDPANKPFYLARFDQDPLPRFTYVLPTEAGGTELEVTLALARGRNAAVLRYRYRGPGTAKLVLRPLLAARGFHQLQRENGAFINRVELRANDDGTRSMTVRPKRDLPRLAFGYDGTFVGSPDWWRRFEYLTERDRGLDFEEDLWTPGVFEASIDATTPRYLSASVDRYAGDPAEIVREAEAALATIATGVSPLEAKLAIACDAFRADLAARPGVLAGYPWFEVWGRDTLIALPGLYLVPKRLDGAMRVLSEMVASMVDGLIPNRIPDAGAAPELHTADATLWLFEAARLCAEALGIEHPFIGDVLYPALATAYEAAIQGTRNAIHITPDGLFCAGSPNDSLTWMDARVDGRAITSRWGCPVELTALWAKGCETLAKLAASRDPSLCARARHSCELARQAFRDRFWCEETQYPFDVVSEALDGPKDQSIRCNAVLALAVDPDCFDRARAHDVLGRAARELVTPAGLRTLSPLDSHYAGRYGGGVAERDGAYHQGTVWPWLLGFYVRAAVRFETATPAELRALVESAAANSLALGHVAEVADGDAPHTPNGCFAQAWSAAELLRSAVWDLKAV